MRKKFLCTVLRGLQIVHVCYIYGGVRIQEFPQVIPYNIELNPRRGRPNKEGWPGEEAGVDIVSVGRLLRTNMRFKRRAEE